MSIPRWRRLRGSTPATSASPPVLRKGATSEATKRTFSLRSAETATTCSGATTVCGGATLGGCPDLAGPVFATPLAADLGTDLATSADLPLVELLPTFNLGLLGVSFSARWVRAEPLRRVDPVVDVREDVVLCFNGCQVLLVHLSLLQIVVKPGEADHVFIESSGSVGNCCSRGHNKGPVARLQEHQLAGGLFEGAHRQGIGGAPVAARQFDHAFAGRVDVPPRPSIALVQPLLAVALESPGRGTRRGKLIGGVPVEILAGRDGLNHALIEVQLAEQIGKENRSLVQIGR